MFEFLHPFSSSSACNVVCCVTTEQFVFISSLTASVILLMAVVKVLSTTSCMLSFIPSLTDSLILISSLYSICMQGLSVSFACVGSGNPVRVLRLYTANTLDIFWSIYYWGICTTCRYQFYCVVLKPYALRLPTATATAGQLTSLCVCVWHLVWRWVSHTVLCGALYTACVDASRTVFWDRSVLF